MAAKQMFLHLNSWNISNKLTFRDEEVDRYFNSSDGSKMKVKIISLDIGN